MKLYQNFLNLFSVNLSFSKQKFSFWWQFSFITVRPGTKFPISGIVSAASDHRTVSAMPGPVWSMSGAIQISLAFLTTLIGVFWGQYLFPVQAQRSDSYNIVPKVSLTVRAANRYKSRSYFQIEGPFSRDTHYLNPVMILVNICGRRLSLKSADGPCKASAD